MTTPEIVFDFKSAKKVFSRIGLALILFFVATIVAQIVFMPLIPRARLEGEYAYTVVMLFSSATMYLIGFPIFYFTVRPLEREVPEKHSCSGKTLLFAFLISVSLLYVGQIVGEFLYITFYNVVGFAFTSDSIEILSHVKWYEALVYAVIVGPLVEEVVFRKIIIDRTKMYGEKLSMVFSALMFAFFHMNMQQFFYAFLVGLLYGYLYLRRGNLFVCWVLHALFNFFGSVLPLIIYDVVDMEAFLTAADMEEMYKLIEENMLGYSVIAAYSFGTMALAVIGFNILMKRVKRARFEKTSLELPRDFEATVAFTNIGVVLFILFSVVYPIIDAYLQVQV